ncbi:unnamed protein product [Arabis nemorensis]|uniref:Xylanase inhibitor N-terminal domain-containing protein n=1 Tax=Arabis nemorensis TaxID=586526 RepID=A0A565B2P2_9BRAS|nr:unnamed protein product [Arabis nemorensis]
MKNYKALSWVLLFLLLNIGNPPKLFDIDTGSDLTCPATVAQRIKRPDDHEIGYSDEFPPRLANGSTMHPHLTFGCGYDQHNSGNPWPWQREITMVKAFDELVPSSGVTWTSPSMTAKTTGVKDINLIRKDLNGKPLVNEMQSIGWFPSDCDKLPKVKARLRRRFVGGGGLSEKVWFDKRAVLSN